MKKHLIVISSEEDTTVKQKDGMPYFVSSASILGDDIILAQAVATYIVRDERFRKIIMDAIFNLCSGVQFDMEDLPKPKLKPVKGD